MRIRTTLLTGALLLASGFAMAQQAPQTPATQGQTTDVVASPTTGNVDFSVRSSGMSGDVARYQRYQDLRDKGAGLNLTYKRENNNWFFDAGAKNVGYDDQAFHAVFGSAKVKGSFEWNQTPLFYGASDFLKTAYTTQISGSTATMTLDPAIRQAVQNGMVNANGTAKSTPTAVAFPVSVATLNLDPLFRPAMTGLDLRSRRDDMRFGLTFTPVKDVDVDFKIDSYHKNGTQPWGASFAFNDAVELPLPIDNRTTNVEVGAEWANTRGMARVGFEHSIFNNAIDTLVWSNPLRATDTSNSSAYSNGALGSATGRMALWPDSSENLVTAAGMLKLPARSTVNASLAFGSLSQDAALLPHTINTSMAVVPLDRPTAQGAASITSVNLNFNTRPVRSFGLTARYRYYYHHNTTPVFDNSTNIRFDGTLEALGPKGTSESEPVSVKRQTINVDASFTPITFMAFRVGVGNEKAEHTYRMFPDTSETTVRASVDTIGNSFVMLRAIGEHSQRTGTNFEAEVLSGASQQPNMRQYDVANRARNRATLVLDVTPIDVVAFSASYFMGRDKYNEAVQEFGLLNNNNSGYNFGVDLSPARTVSFGFNIGRESYDSRQASRYARPVTPTERSFFDPNNNWGVNLGEKVNNFSANLDLLKAIPRTEIRFGYDYSNSDQNFNENGPRVDALAAGKITGSTFEPLPNVTNKLQQASADVKYFLSPKVAIGGSYYYTKFDVNDFSTIAFGDSLPRFDYLGELSTGYAPRSFKGSTGVVRVLYVF